MLTTFTCGGGCVLTIFTCGGGCDEGGCVIHLRMWRWVCADHLHMWGGCDEGGCVLTTSACRGGCVLTSFTCGGGYDEGGCVIHLRM